MDIFGIKCETLFRNLSWLVLVILFAGSGCAEYEAYQYLDEAFEHRARRDFDAALEANRAAVEALPDDAYMRYRLGRSLYAKEMYDDAQLELERAIELEPEYISAYLVLAMVFEVQEMSEAAIACLELAIERVPASSAPYKDLTSYYLVADRLDQALTLLKDVDERWPDATWAQFRLGNLYQRLQQYDEAEKVLRKILEVNPKSIPRSDPGPGDAYGALGNVFFDKEEFENAADAYQKAIELNPRDHNSLNNLAWVYAMQGIHLDEALRYSRRSLRLSPDRPTYLDTLAELFFKNGDHDRALKIIRYAISLTPENGDPELRDHLQNQLKKFLISGHGKV